MDLVSKILIPKLSPNHVGIGSRTERLRVRKAKINPCKYKVYKGFLFFY